MQRLGIIWICALLAFTAGCNGLDDDSDFAISTKASFFLTDEPSGQGMEIHRLAADGAWTMAWNARVGMPSISLSGMQGKGNMLWLASGSRREIVEVSTADNGITRRFDDLPIAPHVFAVGDQQILIGDTAENAIAFVSIKKQETPFIRTSIEPRLCIFNNNRFYLVHGIDSVSIYDETALHPRGYAATGTYIDDIMFDNYYNIRVASHDSVRTYVAIIGANGDYLAEPNYPVDYTQIRYSPYFYPRYGTEITKNLQLTDGVLQTTMLEPLIDSLDHFEADFFSSVIYGTWQDTLHTYSYREDSLICRRTGSTYFPYRIRKSYFQYGNDR